MDLIAKDACALVIVSTRRHAKDLFKKAKLKIADDRLVRHLSAQMCGVHRLKVLDEIKAALTEKRPCLLISTQLIEAGVDIDFPVVYREVSGVDSMCQAAGRCNREGLLPGGGKVVLFESADHEVPGGFLRAAAQQGALTLKLPSVAGDLLGSESVERYFRLLYSDCLKGDVDGMDKYHVLSELLPRKLGTSSDDMLLFQFRKIGENFKLIEDNSCPVIIPYGEEGRDLTEALRRAYDPSERRRLVRKLQRYTVSVYGHEPPCDASGGMLCERIHDTCWVLTSPELYYSEDFGFTTEAADEILLEI